MEGISSSEVSVREERVRRSLIADIGAGARPVSIMNDCQSRSDRNLADHEREV